MEAHKGWETLLQHTQEDSNMKTRKQHFDGLLAKGSSPHARMLVTITELLIQNTASSRPPTVGSTVTAGWTWEAHDSSVVLGHRAVQYSLKRSEYERISRVDSNNFDVKKPQTKQ